MKKHDFILILICLFVFRIIFLSGSFPDALCLLAILGYRILDKYITESSITSELKNAIEKDSELNKKQIQILADEVNKAKIVAESVKASMNFLNKR